MEEVMDTLTNKEMLIVLSLARRCLADADNFDEMAEELKLTDKEMQGVRAWLPGKLNEFRVENYLATGGSACPVCGSTSCTGTGGVEIDTGGAWQNIECEDCGATWQDQYKLTRLEDLEEN
jgi:hypothetical protein